MIVLVLVDLAALPVTDNLADLVASWSSAAKPGRKVLPCR